MKTPEGKVKAALKKQLDNWHAYHFWPVQTGYGKSTLDCLACIAMNPGVFWGIECKREGIEKPTPRQAQVMREIRAAGGRTFVVTMQDDKLKWIEIRD